MNFLYIDLCQHVSMNVRFHLFSSSIYSRVGHPSCLPALQLGLQGLQFGLQGLQFAVWESLNNISLYFQSKCFRCPRLTIWSPRLTICLKWVKKLANCKPKAYNAQPCYSLPPLVIGEVSDLDLMNNSDYWQLDPDVINIE